MKRTASGEPLWRDFRVRVCIPEQPDIVWRNHAKERCGYSEADLDRILDACAEKLEKHFPTIEFRMVELAPNRINFIYHGRKEGIMPEVNGCPEVARAPKIATEICAKLGHKLSVYQNGMSQGPQGPQMNTINFCSACGLSLNEVRGDLDARINAAVEAGIQQRLQSAKQVPSAAVAGPGIELVRDVKAKVVESPS